MSRVSKFEGLARYFEQLREERIDLTFEQIEYQIGEKLCDSAYRHEAYWYLSATHIMPKSWIENNYRMINLSLKNRTVSFIKDSIAQNQDVNKLYDVEMDSSKLDNNNQSILEAAYLVENVEKFYEELKGDVNSRYLSWEHCYSTFCKYKDMINLSEDDIDFLELHLAFYLSSWGMYRGSSFLLQKDYKVHIDVVKELMKKEYHTLWAITYDKLQEESNLDLLFLLSKRIKDIYIEKRRNVKERDDVSSILITKVWSIVNSLDTICNEKIC